MSKHNERFWNSTETGTILDHWETRSAKQIAEQLHRSRSSVMGKVMRLTRKGLLPSGVKKHYEFNPRATILRQPKPKPLAPVFVETELHKLLNSDEPPPPAPPRQGCSILELNGHTCRWPLSEDPADPDFIYCGARTLRGVSYCPHHARIAHHGKVHP
jgi:GcrA cell cycle regulator